MSPHQTIAVAARLFAIWLALGLPTQLYGLWRLGDIVATPGLRLLTAAAALLSAVVAVVLWFFPLTVARKLLRTSDQPAPPPAAPQAAPLFQKITQLAFLHWDGALQACFAKAASTGGWATLPV